MPRRLAAIMFTDIIGFAALTQRDEKAALQLLQDQENLLLPLLGVHRGRHVKTVGDGLLLEFPNALDAVEFGVEFQRRVHERNARPGSEPLRLRVGIHLGDVQDVGPDIFGDAVNTAARIESLADPGGICLSEPVYVQVRNKVPCGLERLGARPLKGVPGSMELYRAVLPWEHDRAAPKQFLSRRLAAIMYTDVVGFTASAQANEADALARLREQEGIVRPLFEPYKGREIKSTGDGFLVEFESALGALECAIEIQRQMRERNTKKSRTPLELRIGIHVGDVEESAGDIFGDAVNVASRIVPLAEPGGICLSTQVYDQVHNKAVVQMEKLGSQSLKGVRDPVVVYRTVLPRMGNEGAQGGTLPHRLAVLPLANISPDPADGYFADGLTEELISTLSQLSELRVIARTSVMPYKTAPRSVAQVGADLGVGSVLEGSVRKVGDRLRITVQLIDVSSQEHTWAETYDRRLEDVFAVQTEVAKRIAGVLRIKLGQKEETRLREHPTIDPDSYLAYLKGRSLASSDFGEEKLRNAKKQFELAISIDPANARAYSGLADVAFLLGWWHYDEQGEEWFRGYRAHAARANELDPNLAEAHCSLALGLWLYDHDFVATERELKLALSLNPSYSFAHWIYGTVLMDEGRTEDALREFALAEGLDPRSGQVLHRYSWLLIMLGRLDEAKAKIEKLKGLDEGDALYHSALSLYYLATSDFSQALRELKMTGDELSWRAIAVYTAAGERSKAKKLLEEMEGKPSIVSAPDRRAMGYALLGDLDECFRLLDEAFEKHALPFQPWRNDPMLEPVRRDPRFAQLLKKMNLV